MKRTAFLRRAPDASRLTVPLKVAKPAPGPRKRRCKVCRSLFVPRSITHKACGAGCAVVVAETERKAKERKEDRARKQAMKPRTKWLAEAQAAVNALVRYRDRHDGCISCERPATWDGQWHASHFKSVGSAPALRFDLANIHKSCSICNNHLSGNIGAYTPRLLAKVGQAEFDRLNGPQPVMKWSIEEIAAMKKWAVSLLKQLQQGG